MKDLTTFSKRLKEARQKAGLTQAQLAEKADTTAATVSSYENPNSIKKASLDIVVNFAEALNVSIDWLCGKDDNNSNNVTNFSVQDYLYSIVRVITEMNIIIEDNPFDEKKMLDITFTRRPLIAFIKKAEALLDVYHEGTLDEEFYIACIDKLVKKYSCYDFAYDNFLNDEEAAEAEQAIFERWLPADVNEDTIISPYKETVSLYNPYSSQKEYALFVSQKEADNIKKWLLHNSENTSNEESINIKADK